MELTARRSAGWLAIARALKSQPALIGYLINCPISADTVRERGLKRIKAQLEGLIAMLHRGDAATDGRAGASA